MKYRMMEVWSTVYSPFPKHVGNIHTQKNQYSYLRKRIQVIKVTKDLSDLNDQHVLSEVIPLFEDYSNRCGGGRWWHGRELQPQRLLLWGHYFAFIELHHKEVKQTVLFVWDIFLHHSLFDLINNNNNKRLHIATLLWCTYCNQEKQNK